MVKLTNISGGMMVFDLANGTTFRLANKQSATYPDSVAMQKHVQNLIKHGLIRKEIIREKQAKPVEKSAEKAEIKKEKEEKQNGDV